MSSHHIVRDEQEPALLIADPQLLDCPWLGDLLEWSPIVLVLEEALDKALSVGFKMDIVYCTPDQLEIVTEKVAHQYPIEVLEMASPSIEKGLALLVDRKHPAINIVSQAPAKTLNLSASSYQQVDVVIYHTEARVVQSARKCYEKWLQKGTLLHLFTGEATAVENLQAINSEQFEVLSDGLVRLKGKADFWVKEPL